MSRSSGNVRKNAAKESFFSSLKIEQKMHKTYRTGDETTADVSNYIESFYNLECMRSTIDYMKPIEFERQAGLA
jgi:putative transposase